MDATPLLMKGLITSVDPDPNFCGGIRFVPKVEYKYHILVVKCTHQAHARDERSIQKITTKLVSAPLNSAQQPYLPRYFCIEKSRFEVCSLSFRTIDRNGLISATTTKSGFVRGCSLIVRG